MYRLSRRVSLRHFEADNSYWAFDLQDGSHYELNEPAFLILSSLTDGADLVALGAKLASQYGIDSDVAVRDVEATLTDLESLGLLEAKGAP